MPDSDPVVAVGLAILVMIATRTLHPPSGIDAFLTASQGLPAQWLQSPVLVGAVLLAGFARIGRIRLAFDSIVKYSHMAMQSAANLDRTFRALADGTRRSMIHALSQGDARSAGELGRQFRSAQPTISKHLKVLEQAGLVERVIEGRVHRFRLHRKPLQEAEGWIARHQAFWTGAVDQLERLLSEVAKP